MDQIIANAAPQAIGPYSQAIVANGFVFCSGQIPLMPDGTLITGDIATQTKQALENLKAVLVAAGSDLKHVVRTTVFLVDMADFAAMNKTYSHYFQEHKPARATVAVKALPKNAGVEIDCIATTEQTR